MMSTIKSGAERGLEAFCLEHELFKPKVFFFIPLMNKKNSPKLLTSVSSVR